MKLLSRPRRHRGVWSIGVLALAGAMVTGVLGVQGAASPAVPAHGQTAASVLGSSVRPAVTTSTSAVGGPVAPATESLTPSAEGGPLIPLPGTYNGTTVQHASAIRAENWAGYLATAPTGKTFGSVSGTWQMPTISCTSATSFTSQWIGIDGYGNNSQTVEQIGTAVACSGGVPQYSAWYEMYGDNAVNGGASVTIPLGGTSSGRAAPVTPGDTLAASVSVSNDQWTLSLQDTSTAHTSWNYTAPSVTFSAQQASAEWIVERPEVCTSSAQSSCTTSTLAASTPVAFTAAQASFSGGAVQPLSSFSPAQVVMVDQNSGSTLATPSSIEGGSAFTVTTAPGTATPAAATAPACTTAPFKDVPVDSQFCGDIAWLKSTGITTGFAGDTFHPASSITRAAMAAYLYRLTHASNTAPACTKAPFTDVTTTSQFCGEIAWLKAEGITTGYANGSYHPASGISRAAMAAYLYRLMNASQTAPACTKAPFTDVTTTSQFCGEIAWLKAEGITTGYANGSYHPASGISRAAMAAYLYRLVAAVAAQSSGSLEHGGTGTAFTAGSPALRY